MGLVSVLFRLADWWRKRRAKVVVARPLVEDQQPAASVAERPYDLILIAAVLALLGVGTIEIYSATAAEALTHYNDSAHFLERQLGYLACGGIAMWYAARLDYR